MQHYRCAFWIDSQVVRTTLEKNCSLNIHCFHGQAYVRLLRFLPSKHLPAWKRSHARHFCVCHPFLVALQFLWLFHFNDVQFHFIKQPLSYNRLSESIRLFNEFVECKELERPIDMLESLATIALSFNYENRIHFSHSIEWVLFAVYPLKLTTISHHCSLHAAIQQYIVQNHCKSCIAVLQLECFVAACLKSLDRRCALNSTLE